MLVHDAVVRKPSSADRVDLLLPCYRFFLLDPITIDDRSYISSFLVGLLFSPSLYTSVSRRSLYPPVRHGIRQVPPSLSHPAVNLASLTHPSLRSYILTNLYRAARFPSYVLSLCLTLSFLYFSLILPFFSLSLSSSFSLYLVFLVLYLRLIDSPPSPFLSRCWRTRASSFPVASSSCPFLYPPLTITSLSPSFLLSTLISVSSLDAFALSLLLPFSFALEHTFDLVSCLSRTRFSRTRFLPCVHARARGFSVKDTGGRIRGDSTYCSSG